MTAVASMYCNPLVAGQLPDDSCGVSIRDVQVGLLLSAPTLGKTPFTSSIKGRRVVSRLACLLS